MFDKKSVILPPFLAFIIQSKTSRVLTWTFFVKGNPRFRGDDN